MRAFKRYSRKGFTLVELMIVVAIIGILAALAIYGVRRYMAAAKTSEAKNTIGAIARGGQQAYERESAGQELLPEGSESVIISHDLCGGAVNVPIGGAATVPAAKKYQPNSDPTLDYNTGDNLSGWKCLKFSVGSPHYYQYGYRASTIAAGAASGDTITAPGVADAGAGQFVAWAAGDIDNDTILSGFAQRAEVNQATRSIRLATQVDIIDEYE